LDLAFLLKKLGFSSKGTGAGECGGAGELSRDPDLVFFGVESGEAMVGTVLKSLARSAAPLE
jgi:hypothetical protein